MAPDLSHVHAYMCWEETHVLAFSAVACVTCDTCAQITGHHGCGIKALPTWQATSMRIGTCALFLLYSRPYSCHMPPCPHPLPDTQRTVTHRSWLSRPSSMLAARWQSGRHE